MRRSALRGAPGMLWPQRAQAHISINDGSAGAPRGAVFSLRPAGVPCRLCRTSLSEGCGCVRAAGALSPRLPPFLRQLRLAPPDPDGLRALLRLRSGICPAPEAACVWASDVPQNLRRPAFRCCGPPGEAPAACCAPLRLPPRLPLAASPPAFERRSPFPRLPLASGGGL